MLISTSLNTTMKNTEFIRDFTSRDQFILSGPLMNNDFESIEEDDDEDDVVEVTDDDFDDDDDDEEDDDED